MINYCGSCNRKTHVKPCHIPDLGGMEDYLCAKCRRELGETMTVEVLRIDYSDL